MNIKSKQNMTTQEIKTELAAIEALIAKCNFDNNGNPVDPEYWMPVFDRQEELEDMLYASV